MGAINTIDDLLASLRTPQSIYKASLANAVVGGFTSLWTAAGLPTLGATPASGSGAVPTSATAGAIPLPTLASGETLYLAGAQSAQATAGVLILIDRLVHTSGLSGTVATAQTVNTAALTRYTDGVGVEAALEWYSATGSTAVTFTSSYTEANGTSPAGRTSVATSIPANTNVGRFIPFGGLASGHLGVKTVETVTLSASTLTAGNFGVTLFKRLAQFPVLLANTGFIYDALAVKQALANFGASQPCLSFIVLCSATSTGIMVPTLNFAVK